jgi:hypothetical protein
MNVFDPAKCKCQARESYFLLAQFYYDTEQYEKAWRWYSKVQDIDLRGEYSFIMFLYLNKTPFSP